MYVYICAYVYIYIHTEICILIGRYALRYFGRKSGAWRPAVSTKYKQHKYIEGAALSLALNPKPSNPKPWDQAQEA